MSDGSGAVTAQSRRRWLLLAVGACVVLVAVVIGVAVWGGAPSEDACAATGDEESEAQLCTLNHYLDFSSLVLRGTLSGVPIEDPSMLPVGSHPPGATVNINATQPEDVAWHSFTPTQVLYADPRLEYRGQQVPTVDSTMPLGMPLETSAQLASGAIGDGVADVVVFGTWLGTDLIAGYHVVGPPAGIVNASSLTTERDEAPFINARLVANIDGGLNDDDLWLAEIAERSSARTALLREELEDCLAETDPAARQACG